MKEDGLVDDVTVNDDVSNNPESIRPLPDLLLSVLGLPHLPRMHTSYQHPALTLILTGMEAMGCSDSDSEKSLTKHSYS